MCCKSQQGYVVYTRLAISPRGQRSPLVALTTASVALTTASAHGSFIFSHQPLFAFPTINSHIRYQYVHDASFPLFAHWHILSTVAITSLKLPAPTSHINAVLNYVLTEVGRRVLKAFALRRNNVHSHRLTKYSSTHQPRRVCCSFSSRTLLARSSPCLEVYHALHNA